ncbi:MAG: hypothetical protein DRJ28_00455 [Actinobacteria bacterium]|nr:MAG: hypothetical protein DRJ28_00455 [Actinomycetota bacterium]
MIPTGQIHAVVPDPTLNDGWTGLEGDLIAISRNPENLILGISTCGQFHVMPGTLAYNRLSNALRGGL